MELFNFKDFDEKVVSNRLRDFKTTFKCTSILLIYFYVKFVIQYHYINFIPIFITLYLLTFFSYTFTYKLTKNQFASILSYFIILNIELCFMMFITGGIRAPGIVWLTILPFIGSILLGLRGYLWGVLIIISCSLIFLYLNYLHFDYFPYNNMNEFQTQFKINILLFMATTFYITLKHISSEEVAQKIIHLESEKNENLLRILFHDLSNPMQTIKLLINKLKSNRSVEENTKALDQIDKISIQIVEILNQVRKIKAIEDGKILLELKPLFLVDSFEKILEIFNDKIKQKNIALIFDESNDKRASVLVDQVYFTQQVLGNIFSNAIKFSKENGTITIKWTQIDDELFLIISDNGIGMPLDIIDNLFNENKHRSRIGTYGEVGTGYGMPLVKTFIEQFNGRIEITSREVNDIGDFHGTTITIVLPAIN